ncbi:hypothetical protein MBAV_002817 [Candidatus Magnetobacterium bavaricum]|uniref:Uncharacterized protein n=1 Tax=Candidatus Magnetobacterium bavaricum TaxID=29290 RepID=A0A0F3GT07_9BACT|nr:hypothetical protein MBAV_002817 [Candidatus Magnetobacterium bavaricum]
MQQHKAPINPSSFLLTRAIAFDQKKKRMGDFVPPSDPPRKGARPPFMQGELSRGRLAPFYAGGR